MEKSLVSAARWLGVCLILSSIILAMGMGKIARQLGGNRTQDVSLRGFPSRIEVATPNPIKVERLALRLEGNSGAPFEVDVRDKTVAKPVAQPATQPQ